MRHSLVVVALVCAASASQAQIADIDPDWREAEAPPPVAFNTEGLIPLEILRSPLRFGVMPSSVVIGSDDVVRYVVAATSDSGAVNGMYEGIRCNTGEFKVYARYSRGNGWVVVKDAQWRSLYERNIPPHSLLIAKSGACRNRSANRPVSTLLRDLRSGEDTRFERP